MSFKTVHFLATNVFQGTPWALIMVMEGNYWSLVANTRLTVLWLVPSS